MAFKFKKKSSLLKEAEKELKKHKKIKKKEVKVPVFFKKYALAHPKLAIDLIRAGRKDVPEQFVMKTFMLALYLSLGLSFVLFMIFLGMEKEGKFVFFLFPIILFVIFSYFMQSPVLYAKKQAAKIDREIVYVTRFLIIEIKSGVPLYQAIVNISKNFEVIGKIFEDIIEKVELGDELEVALNETITYTPSENLGRVLSQVINSLKTGADLSIPLKSVLNQIIREQQIDLKAYARKLNPLSMFYMMIAVIIPTLGTTMLTVLATFINIKLGLGILMGIAGFFTFMQFMFFTIIKSNRPAVEI